MCAKDDLIRRKSLLLTSTQTPNYVDTFSSDFAFSFNILSLIAFIISYCLFADKLRLIPSTLLAKFIPTTKIRNSLLKKNAAKSGILLACVDGRTRQYYLTICAILANYEEQVLLTSIKKNCYCTHCTKHYNFNIYVSLATDTLHLLLKGLIMHSTSLKHFNNKRAFTELIAVVSLLFISKAPFALHFIYAVCDLVTLAQYKIYQRTLGEEKNFNYPKALDSICTRANSEAYYITIRTALLAANYATIVKQRIQPYLIKLPLSEVAANIAISNFIYAAAQFSSKRHNDSKHCNEEVLYLILIIINYTCYDKDRKHIAYIKAFSKVLLFNNNRQINNTTRMLSVPFKFYDLSTIICSVHLVPRDLPNSTTYTTISYYVNNYID
ncbi:hypothetical protein HBI49_234710 [Parastagonospora nodorum]|nr:hypothetical protein HBI49_234710 [Parastagonospora nodorum]